MTSEFNTDGIISRLLQLDSDLVIANRARDISDLRSMRTSDSLDLAKLDAIMSDMTEVQINMEQPEWEQLEKRYQVFCEGRL